MQRSVLVRVAVLAAVLLCGCTSNQSVVIDHRGTPGTPPARAGAMAVYDAANGTIVMFGGADKTGVSSETWTWDGEVWRRQQPATSPPAREHQYMAFDPATARVVIFGGLTCAPPGPDDPIGCDYVKNATSLADTWSWDGTTWTQLEAKHVPPVRYFIDGMGGLAPDTVHRRLMLVTYGPPAPDYLVQTWILENGDWKRLQPRHSPVAEAFSGPAFDAVSGRVILQQQASPRYDPGPGSTPRPTVGRDTTWSWDGSDWQDLGPGAKTPHLYGRLVSVGTAGLLLIWANGFFRWSGSSWDDGRLLPETVSPSLRPREDWAAAYHEPTHRLVLLGGRPSGQNHLFADTAGWDGSTWVTLVPAPPSPQVTLAACSANQASAGYGGGPAPPDPSATVLQVGFFEPNSGPCHLTVDVVLTFRDSAGRPLPIAGNPSTQHVDADLTWDAGGQAVRFIIAGYCAIGQGVDVRVVAGDLHVELPWIGTSCLSAVPPAPSITHTVEDTGLRP